jgi:hypothetical protein
MSKKRNFNKVPADFINNSDYLNPLSALAGRKIMDLKRSKTAETVIPSRRKGIKRIQTRG